MTGWNETSQVLTVTREALSVPEYDANSSKAVELPADTLWGGTTRKSKNELKIDIMVLINDAIATKVAVIKLFKMATA